LPLKTNTHSCRQATSDLLGRFVHHIFEPKGEEKTDHSHGAEDTQQGNQIGRAAKRRRNQNVAQRVTAEGFKDEEETSVAAGEKRKKV